MSNLHCSLTTIHRCPDVAGGHYPERPQTFQSWFQKTVHSIAGIVTSGPEPGLKLRKTISGIHHYGQLLGKIGKLLALSGTYGVADS